MTRYYLGLDNDDSKTKAALYDTMATRLQQLGQTRTRTFDLAALLSAI